MSVSFSRKQIRKFFNGVTPAEIAFIDGVTAGTATASKALVLDASKGIATITTTTITTLTSTTATITTVNATNVDAGASGTAGSVDVFPTTAANGKMILAAVDAGGAFNTTISNKAMGQSSVISIPDPGAATADFVLNAGTATIAGAKTFSSALTVNPTTNQLVLGVTNTTTISATAPSTSRVITLADPGANANLITSVGIGSTQVVRTSASVTANATTTYANVTGLSHTVQVGTYAFKVVLPSTVASGTGGIKYCFNYTTAVLSALESTAVGYTSAAVNVEHVTSTTTQADLYTEAAVIIYTEISGTMVVSTGGTVAVQMAQNTSNASDTIALLGGYFEITRIA